MDERDRRTACGLRMSNGKLIGNSSVVMTETIGLEPIVARAVQVKQRR